MDNSLAILSEVGTMMDGMETGLVRRISKANYGALWRVLGGHLV